MAEVVIVGAGPAGLAAAAVLGGAGHQVTVIEREGEPGGIPRFCGHSPFGLREFRRIMGGDRYARQLAERARQAGAAILTGHSAVGLDAKGFLRVTTPSGLQSFAFDRLLLATGTREATAAARLAPGGRPWGVMNTGALQRFAAAGAVPFRRPVIWGSELVALSAILTCRSLGIRPVALIEEEPELRVRRPFGLFPRLMRIPLYQGAMLSDIHGTRRVEGVELRLASGGLQGIACDGVIVAGRFTPEAALARTLGLAIDPLTGGPQVDAAGRCSDPRVFAAGNLLRPVETAGWCWQEGRGAAARILADLERHRRVQTLPVEPGAGIRWVVPQRLPPGGPDDADRSVPVLQLRLAGHGRGVVELRQNDALLLRRRVSHGPESRIVLSLAGVALQAQGAIQISYRGQ